MPLDKKAALEVLWAEVRRRGGVVTPLPDGDYETAINGRRSGWNASGLDRFAEKYLALNDRLRTELIIACLSHSNGDGPHQGTVNA